MMRAGRGRREAKPTPVVRDEHDTEVDRQGSTGALGREENTKKAGHANQHGTLSVWF